MYQTRQRPHSRMSTVLSWGMYVLTGYVLIVALVSVLAAR